MQSHPEISYVGPRNVRSLDHKVFAEKFGMDYLEKIGINVEKLVCGTALDSIQAPLTTASIGVPIQFAQTWLPGFVRIATAPQLIDELTGITTMGRWEDAEIVQGIIENLGTALPYGDYTNVPLASYDPTFERRSVIRFEEGLRVGRLEEKRNALVQLNAAQEKRMSAMLNLDVIRNATGFFGYNSGLGRTYGLLNDPNLPAYVTVAATGTGSSTLWSTKTFQNIIADLRTAFVALRTQSNGLIDPGKDAITIGLPVNCYDYLTITTDFGVSVLDWLRKAYPNIRIVAAPQFNSANGGANVFYVYAESVKGASTDNGRTFDQIVPTKFMALGTEVGAKYYEEDYTNATAGVLLKRPFAVVRYTGI